ncbi:MAG: hypothetical protein VX278_17595 [Myxococcota bacterium]|nr:hypothetical protein [Myxococcota bacterium]
MKRILSLISAVGLFGLSQSAHAALNCKEIVKLKSYETPDTVIIRIMQEQESTAGFGQEEVACLEKNKVSPAIIEIAKQIAAANQESTELAPIERGMDGDSDFEEDNQLDDVGNQPSEIMEARNKLKSNKPLTASFILYTLIEEYLKCLAEDRDEKECRELATYPQYNIEIYYYLAKSLENLKLYHSAQHYYIQVVKAGPKTQYFNSALPMLVKLSRITGDERTLRKVAERLPANRFPRKAKNHLHYLLGVKNFSDEEYRKSQENFSKVTSRSILQLKARFFEGVIALKSNPQLAVRAFRDVYEERVEPQDEREARQIENIKDLALLNHASIYYTGKKFSDASKLYQEMNRESKYWPESLFRDAWANFMLNNLDITLGKILTVESPYFRDNQFIPESTILKALTYLRFCDFSRVEKIIAQFKGEYEPVHKEIEAVLTEYESPEAQKFSDKVWDRYFGEEDMKDTQLPKAIFNKILSNQELANTADHLSLMREESAKIDVQKPQWRDSLGKHLQDLIQEDLVRYKRRAGILLLNELQTQEEMIRNLMDQTGYIEIDLMEQQKSDFERKAANINTLSFNQKFNVDFATSADFIYWPFNKEFWADELGYYSIIADNSCK